jgi:peptide/nickel transport system permease protein
MSDEIEVQIEQDAASSPGAPPRRGLNSWDNPWLNPKFLTGAAIIIAVALFSVFGGYFWDTKQAFVGSSPLNLRPVWDGGVPEHPLGTESNGRDMLAQMIVAIPSSLKVGVIAASIGLAVGLVLGSMAGYFGGGIDNVIRTFADAVVTIPALAVLIVIAAFFPMRDTTSMAFTLALFAWPGPTRIVRSQVLSLRERGYVRMAVLSGERPFGIMFREMLPNMLPWLAASLTAGISASILGATSLEALGLGPTRIPSLGTIINQAMTSSALIRGMVWWWFPPILALMIIFISFFFITIGLDEIANPRLREYNK